MKNKIADWDSEGVYFAQSKIQIEMDTQTEIEMQMQMLCAYSGLPSVSFYDHFSISNKDISK